MPESKIAVCAGSFDPPTLGHVDLIDRAARLFGRVIVAVGVNPRKKTLFSVGERIDLLNRSLAGIAAGRPNPPIIEVASCDGLIVDFCRSAGACALVRGLRAAGDFDSEFLMGLANKDLAPEIETVFLIASPGKCFLSSSAVKEIAACGRDISPYVPECVVAPLMNKFRLP